MITVVAVAVVALVCALVATVAALRWRKLRRDELRVLDRRRRAEAMANPATTQPLRTVRLIGDGDLPVPRSEPPRPRLDAERPYVFTDVAPVDPPSSVMTRGRHNDLWALERSSHRSHLAPGSLLVLIAVAVALGILVVVGAFLHHGPSTSHGSTSTTTTEPTAALTWPSVLTPSTVTADQSTYAVPQTSYTVTVTGAHGPVWIVIEMGSSRTLEHQGEVASGGHYSLALRGDSWVSLGSPHNAVVTVNGHGLTTPSAESAPFTVAFAPVR